ncbi:unnamed protein product, partial [Iphiclides podalirius]
MRSRLFAERDLDYKRAVELALALEAADRHAATSAVSGSIATVPSDGIHRVAAVAGKRELHRAADARAFHLHRQRPPGRQRCDVAHVRGVAELVMRQPGAVSRRIIVISAVRKDI